MQPHNLKLRAQVDFIIETRCHPVLVGQAILAHHNYWSLYRGNGCEHQIEKNLGIGIDGHAPMGEYIGVE